MATSSDNQSPEALERRPEARAFKIEALLTEVRLGRMRIPPFQRRLNWEREDVCKLFDSLYRGYPVGTLLFWETTAEPMEMQFGSVTISAGKRDDALWVVDGQQRIVSLTRVMLASEPDTDEFALFFDLDDAKFIPPPSVDKRRQDPSRWLPMTEVLDSARLFQWLLEQSPRLLEQSPTSKSRRDRAIQLGKSIREYDIPAYLLRTRNENILREVFERINSSGKKLEALEIFDALHGARSQNRPATIPQIVAELEKYGFGRVEEKILYRLLRVLQGADVSESGRPLRLEDNNAAQTAYLVTTQAAASAIQFLKRDGGIPHYELLPYKQPIVILGKFFHEHSKPQPRSHDLLARWLWRGVLNGTHLGDNVSTRAALKCIMPDNEEDSVQRLINMVGKRPTEYPDVTARFNSRHSTGKLLVIALLELGPRDLETGLLLGSSAFLSNKQTESKFPMVIAPVVGKQTGCIQSVANRLAHPSRPGGLRRLLLEVTDAGILASHGITEAAFSALRDGDSERFLALRAEYLRPLFQYFFERHARWDESDRPSLASLRIADQEH